MSRRSSVDETTILQTLDGRWRTIAEIRGRARWPAAVEVSAMLERLAEEGKIERTSKPTTVIRRGNPLKISFYRRGKIGLKATQ